MMDTSELDPAEYLRRLFDDVEFSYLVVVAAQLGVADLLASGPRSITDLSAATGADAQCHTVSCALARRGLFEEDAQAVLTRRRWRTRCARTPHRAFVRRHCGVVVRPTGAPGATCPTASEPANPPSIMSMASRSLTTLPSSQHLRKSSTT